MTDRKTGRSDTIVQITDSVTEKSEKPKSPSAMFGEMRHSPDQIRDLFRNGKYPYKTKIKKAAYETHKKEPEYHRQRQRVNCDVFPIPLQHVCPFEYPQYLFTPSNTLTL